MSQQIRVLSERVEPKYVGPLVFLAFLSIFICCATSTHCVRTARDCKIALNAMNIRRQYQRNMQLYCLMKEKMLIEASKRMHDHQQSHDTNDHQAIEHTSSEFGEAPQTDGIQNETQDKSFGVSDGDENERLLRRIRENRKNLRAKRRARRNG